MSTSAVSDKRSTRASSGRSSAPTAAAATRSAPKIRLLRTSTFRIAVLYLSLFSATLLALVGFIYWSTAGLIDRQTTETIRAEIEGLAEQYSDEGLDRLAEVIDERSGPNSDPANLYLLADSEFQPLAGNLAAWPQRQASAGGWIDVELRRDGGGARLQPVRAHLLELPGGIHLLVGRSADERLAFQRIMAETLVWALVPALLLGLPGGLLIGRYALRRVAAVELTSREIMGGDLSRRVPLSGSGDEFDRLARTINDMLDQIDQLMAGMRMVTDSLAHDLRSPMTRAKSGIELALRKRDDAPAYRQALEQTGAELDSILRTFEALISIAQAEAGVNRLTLARLDLSALANDLFEVYEPIAEEAGLALSAQVCGGLWVEGHRQLLGQALANLLDNAIKYTPRGGRIRLSLDDPGGVPLVSVADSGPGIRPPDRERVLRRFVRLDCSRSAPGSGLGLSLVAAVAKLHGARLELGDAAPGLRATLSFPRKPRERARSDRRAA